MHRSNLPKPQFFKKLVACTLGNQKISESATVVIIHLIQRMPVVRMSLESKYSERLLGSNVREQVLIVS